MILTLVFILPMNMSIIFAGTATDTQPAPSATNEKVSSICGGGFNVKDSLLMSVVTMCIPGILEKVNEWKNIKCETAVCYYDAVKNNLDPTFCTKQESYRTCTYIVGDIFALPGLNMIDYFRQKVADALANPVGMLVSVATIAARASAKLSCLVGMIGCTAVNVPYSIASNFLVVVDSLSLYQQVKDIFDNGFFPPLNTKSSCDRLPEIKKEMDKIIKYA